MKKLIVTLAVTTAAFASIANAKTTTTTTTTGPGTPIAKSSSYTEREYASSGFPQLSSASGQDNEIETIMTHGSFVSEKTSKDASTGSDFNIAASYLHYLREGFQVGGEGRIQLLSKELSPSGKSATRLDLLAVGAFNFQQDLKNAFFVKAGVGFYSTLNDNRDDYENKLGLFVGAGKRFALLSNVSYTPELRLVKKGDIDLGVELALLNFSVIW